MAFDQTIHEALQRLTASLQQEFDTKLKAAATELAQSAEQEREAAEAASMANLAARLGAAQAEADRRVAEETARARAEAEQQFTEEASRLRGELETARGELDAIRRERDDLQQAVASAREASEQSADAARRQAEEALAAAREQAERAAADLDDVRKRLATAEQALEELQASAASAKQESDRTLAELNDVRSRLATDQQALEELQRSGSEARVEERQDKLATLDRLVASIRRIDGVTSLSDVLTVLAETIAAEAPRSAVLVAAADGFRPFRMSGFAGATPRPVSRTEAASLTAGLPFDLLPPDHIGFSVPIEVGSQAVAVVYADDCTGEDYPVPSSWPEAVEVLTRYAALRLGMLTALKTVQAVKAGQRLPGSAPVSTVGRTAEPLVSASTTEDDQSARRYARLLVSEIKLYNEATVRLGRMNRDLFERLRPEIDRARTLYEQRVPAHVPARSTYFDDELVQTLADGDPGLLGARR